MPSAALISPAAQSSIRHGKPARPLSFLRARYLTHIALKNKIFALRRAA